MLKTAKPWSNHHHARNSSEGCGLTRSADATGGLSCADAGEEFGDAGFGCFIPPHKVGMKLGVRKLQKLAEPPFIRRGQRRIAPVEEALQQRVEFPHAAPATPPKFRLDAARVIHRARRRTRRGRRRFRADGVGAHGGQCRRSAISFLVCAIVLPGLRSFGQASVQLRMVWQRYSRNGSSRASRRSPVDSSRLSTIQR